MAEDTTIDLRLKLLRKLQGGNKRFAHLNATIGRSRDKLDLLDLNKIDEGLPKDFIHQLLTNPNVTFKVPFKDIDAKLLKFTNDNDREDERSPEEEATYKEALENLNSLRAAKKKLEYLEAFQKEEFNELGTKSFAFGYPLLIKQVSAKKDDVICAPLFIWYLDISRDFRDDAVLISRTEESPILFNEMLDFYLETEAQLDLSDEVKLINEKMLDDGLLDAKELDESLQAILKKISSHTDTQVTGRDLARQPKDRKAASQILNDAGSPDIVLNSGVFGVFRSGKQSIINDLKELIELNEEVSPESPDGGNTPEHIFTAIETDPSQHQVINNLKRTQNLIIQGPPGTGKSQTLTALITNALANGNRTLVVCEKRTAMDIIANNLEKCGLSDYFVLIENMNRDRTSVIEKARKIHDQQSVPLSRKADEFELAQNSYQDAAQTVSAHHSSIATLMEKDFGDSKTILGKYWRHKSAFGQHDELDACQESFSKIPFNLDNLEFKEIGEELQRVAPEVIRCSSIVSKIPKERVVKNQSYAIDTEKLTDYFKTKESQFEQIRQQAKDFHVRYMAAMAAHLQKKHDTVKELAAGVLSAVTISRSNFDWPALNDELSSRKLSGSQQLKDILGFVKRLQALQDELTAFQENVSRATSEVQAALSEYQELLKSIQEKITYLRGLGVTSIAQVKSGHLPAVSNKQKEIKRTRTVLTADITKVNGIKSSLPNFLGDPIALDDAIETTLHKELNSIPNNQQIGSYIGAHTASRFTAKEPATQTTSDMTADGYPSFIGNQQFAIYERLRLLLWQVHHAQMEEAIARIGYLRQTLKFDALDESLTDSTIETLKYIQSHVLDPAGLQQQTETMTLHAPINKIPELEQLNHKVMQLLTLGEYSMAYATFQIRSDSASRFQDLVAIVEGLEMATHEAIQEIGSKLFSYHKWCTIYISLNERIREVIDRFTNYNVDPGQWVSCFNALYFEKLVRDADRSTLLNNELAISKLQASDDKIKGLLMHSIASKWSVERGLAISDFSRGALRFNSLYNKRGAPGQRRNPLRKIINRDIRLFTALFPVVICSPSAMASLFKLEKDLFDIVLFDEASQLRLEDTYTSLYRGKVKIVSGDEHQMPPSSYFQSAGIEDDQDADDDEEMQRQEEANSESLLDYATINGYLPTMLKVHYRSDHEDLIEFSNKAFYDGRLIPIPKLEQYRPIEFNRVDGAYSDRCNKDEASAILEWLGTLSGQSEVPSIGVVTLNLSQTDLIKEMISEKRTSTESFNELMSRLEEQGFFVKNLENVQGDERDMMLLSTTFGIRPDGKFLQNFGPLTSKKSYRLLNVLVTRAKHKFIVFTSIPDKYIDTYAEQIQTYGKDGKGIFYAYLAYARAVASGDPIAKQIVLRVLESAGAEEPAEALGAEGMTESPFEDEVLAGLENSIDNDRIKLQYKIGSEKFRIDMVIMTPDKTRPMLAIECDGYTYHSSPDAYLYDIYRQKILEDKGFKFHRIWSTNWFHEPFQELEKLTDRIKSMDDSLVQEA